MIKIKELLKEKGVSIYRYEVINNRYIIDTNKGKYVIKKNKYIDKSKLFAFLESRKFTYYLKPIYSTDEYDIYPYIEESVLNVEEKYVDLVSIIAYLHLRTSFYKNEKEEAIKDKYNDIKDEISSIEKYFYNLQDQIEDIEYMSPSNYLLIRNISIFYKSISLCKEYLEKWYKIALQNKKKRYVTLHNNLNASNILVGNSIYLINW